MCTFSYFEHYQKIMIILSVKYIDSQHIAPKALQDSDYYLCQKVFFSIPEAMMYIFSAVLSFLERESH